MARRPAAPVRAGTRLPHPPAPPEHQLRRRELARPDAPVPSPRGRQPAHLSPPDRRHLVHRAAASHDIGECAERRAEKYGRPALCSSPLPDPGRARCARGEPARPSPVMLPFASAFRATSLVAAAIVTLLAATPPAGGTGGVVAVKIFAPRGSVGTRCDRVYPLTRSVRPPAVLTGAMRGLLAGPTTAERRRGYGGWFSARTAGMLRSARVAGGVAYVDFADFRRVIPNASSSCGSALLLAQLNRTATQFPTVRRAVYSFNGSRRAFYEWLQLSPPRAASHR